MCRTVTLAGTLSLAVAHTFWRHTAIAETYTVSTALLTAELLCAVRFAQTGRAKWIVLLFLANGVGVSNHLLHVLNLPVWGTWLLVVLARRRVSVAAFVGCGLAWFAGAALYLGLVTAELFGDTPAGNVLHSALFGHAYASNVTRATITLQLLKTSILYLGLNFPTPTALLVLVGLTTLRSRVDWRRTFAVLLVPLTIIHLLWAMRYDVPDQYAFFLPSILLIAVWIALGTDVLAHRWRLAPRVVCALALLPVVVYAILPTLAERANLRLGTNRELPYRNTYRFFLQPWQTGYDGPQRFAKEAGAVLSPGDALIGDHTSTRPIHYLRLTGRWPEDVRIWPQTEDTGAYWPDEAEVAEWLDAGRLYVVSPVKRYCPDWILEGYETEPAGVLYRVVPPARNSE
jgi:hypothetical protein